MTTQVDEQRPRSPRGEGGQLREELLDAAERLLIAKGSMDAVSIRAVVNDVGVTAPSLYMHFEDKDELFFEVCWRRFADFHAVISAAAEGITDPVDRLRSMGLAYVRYGVERGEHYKILFAPSAESLVEGRDVSDGPGMQAFALLIQTVQEGMEAGRLACEDPVMGAMIVWSAVHGAVMLELARSKHPAELELPTAEQVGAAVCDVVIRGLTTT